MFSISALIWLMRPLMSSSDPAPFDDGGLVLGDDDLARGTEKLQRGRVSSLRPISSEMTVAPVRMAMSWSMALRRSPNPGALTATDLNVPRILLTTSVARASPSTSSAMIKQRSTRLHDLFEDGQHVTHGRDLARDEQDVGVLQNGLLALGVGREIGGDVALVKAHAFDEVHVHAEGLALFNGNDAVLADLVDGVGDHLADLVVGRGDGRHLGDLLFGVGGLGQVVQ